MSIFWLIATIDWWEVVSQYPMRLVVERDEERFFIGELASFERMWIYIYSAKEKHKQLLCFLLCKISAIANLSTIENLSSSKLANSIVGFRWLSYVFNFYPFTLAHGSNVNDSSSELA